MPRAANGHFATISAIGPNIFSPGEGPFLPVTSSSWVPSRSSALRRPFRARRADGRARVGRSRRWGPRTGRCPSGRTSGTSATGSAGRTRTRRGALVSSRTRPRWRCRTTRARRVRATRGTTSRRTPRPRASRSTSSPRTTSSATPCTTSSTPSSPPSSSSSSSSFSTRSGGTGARSDEGGKRWSSSRRRSTSRRRDGGSSTAAKCSSPCDNPRATSSSPRCVVEDASSPPSSAEGEVEKDGSGGARARRTPSGTGLRRHRRRRNVSEKQRGVLYTCILPSNVSHVDDLPAGPERFVIARATKPRPARRRVLLPGRRRRRRQRRSARSSPGPGPSVVRRVPLRLAPRVAETRGSVNRSSPRTNGSRSTCARRGGPHAHVPRPEVRRAPSASDFFDFFFVKDDSSPKVPRFSSPSPPSHRPYPAAFSAATLRRRALLSFSPSGSSSLPSSRRARGRAGARAHETSSRIAATSAASSVEPSAPRPVRAHRAPAPRTPRERSRTRGQSATRARSSAPSSIATSPNGIHAVRNRGVPRGEETRDPRAPP